jgi:hypothetical protein
MENDRTLNMLFRMTRRKVFPLRGYEASQTIMYAVSNLSQTGIECGWHYTKKTDACISGMENRQAFPTHPRSGRRSSAELEYTQADA